jgi:hemerythrin-like domain-containing protein
MSTTVTMAASSPVTELAVTTWADGPYALIPTPLPNGQKSYKTAFSTLHFSYIMAHEMSHLHNMIIRGLNAIWQQAPYVQGEQDIKDFNQFCLNWHEHMHAHHGTEELCFFPQLEELVGQKGCMDVNVAQHKAFESGLERFKAHCENTTPASYSPGALRAVIASFGHILREHLGDEIPTLLALKDYDSAKLKAIWKKAGDYAKSNGETNVEVPFMIGTYDNQFEGGALSEFNFPLPVMWLSDLVFSRKFSGAWRFLPCDSRSRPRELAFGPKKA